MPSAISAITGSAAQSMLGAQGDLSTDSFMKLLVAELQNQDPLEPMDTKEMMDQLTQLTMVSQLEELGESLAHQSVYRVTEMAALIGRTVEWADPDTGEALSGTVTRTEYGVQGWTAQVGDEAIPLDWITSVQ